MKKTLLLSCLAVVTACSSGPSITRTSKGTYHANAGMSFLSRQKIASATLQTKEGDILTMTGVNQKADTVANSAIYGAVLDSIAGKFYGHENAKVAADKDIKVKSIDADVKKTEIGADVVNKTNSGNNLLEIPGEIPKELPR